MSQTQLVERGNLKRICPAAPCPIVRSERETMEAFTVLAALAVLIGIIGIVVLLKGKKTRRR